MKLFIALDKEGLMVNWKLKEIEPELQSVKSMSGASLKYIFTDTSYGCREIYEDIFPDAQIKLDLFHACQRITRLLTWPKDFRKIWYFVKITTCQKLGTLRKPTPKRKLRTNLEHFLQNQCEYIESMRRKESLYYELKNLNIHIEKGRLSGLPQTPSECKCHLTGACRCDSSGHLLCMLSKVNKCKER